MKKYIKYVIALTIIVILVIIVSTLTIKEPLKDNEKFASEYTTVTKDNVFVYRNAKEIINILEKGTGIVYLGFPECPWCQTYVSILNEVAKEEGIKKIYYFDILDDRKNNTSNYKKIVELLKGNLLFNDEGIERVYVPDVTIIKNGEIIGHDNETSVVNEEDGTPSEYWTTEKKDNLKEKLKNYIKEIRNTSCSKVCDR